MDKITHKSIKYYNIYKILAILLIVFGIIIRLHFYLLDIPLRFDEASLGLNIFERDILSLFMPLEYNQYAPPMFLVLTKYITLLFGFNEKVLRFLPFIFGCLSLVAFAFLSFRTFQNKAVSLLSVVLFNFSLPLIFFSRDFKQYQLEVLIALLTFLLFAKIHFKRFNYSESFLYGCIFAFSFWFSYANLVVFTSLFLYLFFKDVAKYYKNLNKKYFFNILSFIIPATLSFVILYFSNIRYFRNIKSLHNYWDFGFINFNLIKFPSVLSDCVSYLFSIDILSDVWLILPMFILSLIFVVRKAKFDFKINIYILMSISTIFCAIILSFLNIYPMGGRVALYLVPSFILLILFPIDNFSKDIFKYNIKALSHILIIVFFVFFLFPKSFDNFFNADDLFRSRAKYAVKYFLKYDIKYPVIISSCISDPWNFYLKTYDYKNSNILLTRNIRNINFKDGGKYCFVLSDMCGADNEAISLANKEFTPILEGIQRYDAISFFCAVYK